jgi:hypothetical protein
MNYHVDGMHYLCLHRSFELTVKMYLIDKPINPNSGFLVHPHSHRYGFSTFVLHGSLEHWRFRADESAHGDWQQYLYRAETRHREPAGRVALAGKQERLTPSEQAYEVTDQEIHTLRCMGDAPILLGLFQCADTHDTSNLYLPVDLDDYFLQPHTYMPTIAETEALRARCLELLA